MKLLLRLFAKKFCLYRATIPAAWSGFLEYFPDAFEGYRQGREILRMAYALQGHDAAAHVEQIIRARRHSGVYLVIRESLFLAQQILRALADEFQHFLFHLRRHLNSRL